MWDYADEGDEEEGSVSEEETATEPVGPQTVPAYVGCSSPPQWVQPRSGVWPRQHCPCRSSYEPAWDTQQQPFREPAVARPPSFKISRLPSQWQPQQTPISLSSSETEEDTASLLSSGLLLDPTPDERVGDQEPISPSEDLRLFSEHMARMAQTLHLQITPTDIGPEDKILSLLYSDAPELVAFPLLEGIKNMLKSLWKKPASTPATSRTAENMYRVQQEGCSFLFNHPPPVSLIVEELQAKHRLGALSSPGDWEGRKIDTLSRKGFSSAALNLRIANYQAMMGAHQLLLWQKMSDYLDRLPDNLKPLAEILQTEAIGLSKQQIRAGRYAADTAGRAMSNAIVLRRHAWLRSTALPPNIRSRVEDLPFEGSSLFSSKTDDFLLKIKRRRQMARSFGITPAPSRPYRQRYQPRLQQPYPSIRRPRQQYPPQSPAS